MSACGHRCVVGSTDALNQRQVRASDRWGEFGERYGGPGRRRGVESEFERVIAHVKNWKLLATGYRDLLDRFPMFLDTIVKLEIYRTS
jgi:hypothetical protein